ncbi:hypothetical protein, partial [Mesorhizobium sp. M1A.F.Ca.IN.022.07.1.1]|uniref:hypothetical protein n=1 Tax=Mesorhizobium sp. M1A.F.Ca.IN.022.07.1.1 TaxID=2496767 RepID=UPI0019D27D01
MENERTQRLVLFNAWRLSATRGDRPAIQVGWWITQSAAECHSRTASPVGSSSVSEELFPAAPCL